MVKYSTFSEKVIAILVIFILLCFLAFNVAVYIWCDNVSSELCDRTRTENCGITIGNIMTIQIFSIIALVFTAFLLITIIMSFFRKTSPDLDTPSAILDFIFGKPTFFFLFIGFGILYCTIILIYKGKDDPNDDKCLDSKHHWITGLVFSMLSIFVILGLVGLVAQKMVSKGEWEYVEYSDKTIKKMVNNNSFLNKQQQAQRLQAQRLQAQRDQQEMLRRREQARRNFINSQVERSVPFKPKRMISSYTDTDDLEDRDSIYSESKSKSSVQSINELNSMINELESSRKQLLPLTPKNIKQSGLSRVNGRSPTLGMWENIPVKLSIGNKNSAFKAPTSPKSSSTRTRSAPASPKSSSTRTGSVPSPPRTLSSGRTGSTVAQTPNKRNYLSDIRKLSRELQQKYEASDKKVKESQEKLNKIKK